MIVSLKGKLTEEILWSERCPKGFPSDLFQRAKRKLQSVAAANVLSDLRAPPGNRLEALSGDRKGQHSIRINDQWRVCFAWTEKGAEDVEIVDYH
ncbi:MAG TPA: type II toxin-antitoxin system RelE/ParE family toxin [Devosia sp.]